MAQQLVVGQRSPDGRWWWDGAVWQPMPTVAKSGYRAAAGWMALSAAASLVLGDVAPWATIFLAGTRISRSLIEGLDGWLLLLAPLLATVAGVRLLLNKGGVANWFALGIAALVTAGIAWMDGGASRTLQAEGYESSMGIGPMLLGFGVLLLLAALVAAILADSRHRR